mmetsp:Transcript_72241/g.186307  ORF Transcript_72241/g.186307 Transcript_72241/m.186307 type:complete len:204 (-) Transcript_72241:282-893(-)
MDSWVAPCGRGTLRSLRKSSLHGIIFSGFQPMSYSSRSRILRLASSFSRALWSARDMSSKDLAMHSPWRCPLQSWLTYFAAPRGSRHSWHNMVTSPSSSSSASESSGCTSVTVSLLSTEKASFSACGPRPGKQQVAGRVRLLGWNQSRGMPSSSAQHLTPTAAYRLPSLSRTTVPCVKPPTRRQMSWLTSKRAKGVGLDSPST